MQSGADLTLVAGGRSLSGWTEVRVVRGIEIVPSLFEIAMTERVPENWQETVVNSGDPCEVWLGGDRVVTGYVDRVLWHISAQEHSVRVIGRGKCEDLVDCAAIYPGAQISNFKVLDLAQKLAKPYGIEVMSDITDTPPYPAMVFNQGETPFEIIERYSRYSGLLVYEQPDGNLALTRAGKGRMSSGFMQGVNVQDCTVELGMDQRYSEYVAFAQAVDQLGDIGGGGNQVFTVFDSAVPRLRRRVIVWDGAFGPPGMPWQGFLITRAQWECNRRFGRSRAVRITLDSWRDQEGALWEPNMLAEVSMPALKIAPGTELLIGDVAYSFDEQGTKAVVSLYPPDAFLPEPLGIPGTLMEVQSSAAQ